MMVPVVWIGMQAWPLPHDVDDRSPAEQAVAAFPPSSLRLWAHQSPGAHPLSWRSHVLCLQLQAWGHGTALQVAMEPAKNLPPSSSRIEDSGKVEASMIHLRRSMRLLIAPSGATSAACAALKRKVFLWRKGERSGREMP